MQQPFHLPYLLLFVSIGTSLGITCVVSEQSVFSVSYSSIGIGMVFLLSALYLGIRTKRYIQQHETALSPYGSPTTLITSGPFRFSRNPLYLSYVLVTLAVAIFLQEITAFLPPALYFLYLHFRIIPMEERKLHSAFPNTYEIYTRTVRRWL